MKKYSLSEHPKAVICDVDDTLYEHSDDFKIHTFEMDCLALSELWHKTPAEVGDLLTAKKQQLQSASTRVTKPMMREVILECGGVDDKWLGEARTLLWRPEDFIQQVSGLADAFRSLKQRGFKVGFASTSYTGVVLAILDSLGLSKFSDAALGMEFGLKPNPNIYQQAAYRLGVVPANCISVGDSYENDCLPALSLGMGAVHISGPIELRDFLSSFL